MTTAVPSSARLSLLQQQILVLASENKLRENRGFGMRHGADVYYAEVLVRVFGFPLRKDYGGRGPRDLPCNRIFAPAEIGRRGYKSAHASTSRAVLRLHQRELVESLRGKSRWAGCNLTPAGVEIARRLQKEMEPFRTLSAKS